MLINASVQKRSFLPISGGTVLVGSYLEISGALTVNMTSSIIFSQGTYTIFDTGLGIRVNGTLQVASANLDGIVTVTVPSGYAVQSIYVDETGKKVKVDVRTVATA